MEALVNFDEYEWPSACHLHGLSCLSQLSKNQLNTFPYLYSLGLSIHASLTGLQISEQIASMFDELALHSLYVLVIIPKR